MTATKASKVSTNAKTLALACTMLSGLGVAHAQEAQPAQPDASAQTTPAPTPAPVGQATPAPAPSGTDNSQAAPAAAQQQVVKSLRVEGSQRIEPATVLSYTKLRVGEPYTNATLDQAIKDLIGSDFLADVSISGVETGNLVIHITENPVINRVILEGNKKLKDDKIVKEIKLAPRQIFTRTAVRADVARIIELYRRQGRFAAHVDPEMVKRSQNRVDVIFDITEGPKSKVRQINIIGNEKFDDGKLRGEMATKQARWFRIFSSNTSYDQDRLAYDQQKLRQFYLTQGYADFRVISAVAELTPDKRDFIITYVVEEGDRYKFGPVSVDSAIRDFDDDKLARSLAIKEGDWYNAKLVEDSVDQLSETAGFVGYAFTDVQPQFEPDRDAHTMSINFQIAQTARTYVNQINVTGNTQTEDKVIRREMRLAEGDAFNSLQVKRSEDRINSLGYFQDKFEIERKKVGEDRIDLNANVEEKSTGEVSLSAGFSSLERFLVQAAIRQRNFRGKGQEVHAQVDYSSYSKSIELGFTEPYFMNKPIALGGTIFRRDYNSFNYLNEDRNTTYSNVSTGFQITSSVPLTEYWALSGRYSLKQDDVTLDRSQFFTDGQCDPLKAGRYLCQAIGNRLTSLVGLSLIYSDLNSNIRPTRGQRLVVGGDFAGLGGEVQYLRARVSAEKYFNLGSGFIFSLNGQGGYIHSLESDPDNGGDAVRITDRFFLGQQQFRGFDIRGVGPRVQRISFNGIDENGMQIPVTDRDRIADDALGGNAYYLAKAELEIPLGSGAQELGLRPSVFVQAGALFGLKAPELQSPQQQDSNGNPLYIVSNGEGGYVTTTNPTGADGNPNRPLLLFRERYLGDTPSPRVTVGFGVDWNSPFGPLRIDVAKALLKEPGDDSKLFTFNVGRQF